MWWQKADSAPEYDEAAATKAVSGREVRSPSISGWAAGRARVWTCDLTDGYIRINGVLSQLAMRPIHGRV